MSTAKKNLTTCKPKTAVAYARYSSAQQRDVSIEQQLKDIREYAEREGYTIIHEYADHAKSGFKNTDRRVEFHAMLTAAASGMFDTVIAWKVDRFGRNRRESAIYKGQLADNGVSVIYAMEPIPEGAAGVLTEGMLEALAEWYSRTIGENTKRGLYDNAVKGLVAGTAAYGYKRGADDHFVINEEEAAIVRRVFVYYSQGFSIESVVRILNEEGVRTRKGREFQRSSILSILKNEAYTGVYHYGNIKIPGGMPVIIRKDLWDRCQFVRKKTTRHFEKSPEGYLLSGKMTCGYCGWKMYGNYGSSHNTVSGWRRRYYYYACRGKKEYVCRESVFTRKEAIEKPVIDLLLNHLLKDPYIDRFVDLVVETLTREYETSPKAHLEQEYNDTVRKIENINRAISEGIWTTSTGDMLKALTERAEELRANIAYQKATEGKIVTKERIKFFLTKAADGDPNNYEFLKTLANTLINSIVVYRDWLKVAINAKENVAMIPPDDMPPISELTDLSTFDFCSVEDPLLNTVEPYPVIVFKIAI